MLRIHNTQYTIQYNTKYNTIQYNTIQYNTIQYNTIQEKSQTFEQNYAMSFHKHPDFMCESFIYHSVAKECPWAEHLTSLSKKGVGALTVTQCP